MRTGAIACLDALGFKGIWQGEPGREKRVLGKLKRIAKFAKQTSTPLGPGNAVLTLERNVVLFSDTIFIACHASSDAIRRIDPDREHEHTSSLALWWVISATSTVLSQAAASDDPPVAYRGAVSVGRFEVGDVDGQKTFVVGPAVDEVAGAEKLALGAFVWLCPSATRDLANFHSRLAEEPEPVLPLVMDYDVPLHGGAVLRTHVVSPLIGGDDSEMQRDAILGSFDSDRIDVVVKRQHTEAFLARAIAEASERYRRICESVAFRPPPEKA